MRSALVLVLALSACGVGEALDAAAQPVPAGVSTTTAETLPTTSTTAPAPPAGNRPTEEPSPLPEEVPDRGRLVIRAVGDVNLWERYAGSDPEATWSPVRELFSSDDLTIVNLECTPSDLGDPLPKEFTFRCSPPLLDPMAAAGVDVANLANNHSQDFGTEAMLDGRNNLLEAGIAPVGVGRNLAEATTPAVFDLRGWKVAVLGFGGVVPDNSWLATEDRPGMASGDDAELMADAIRRADEIADLVIVTIHWGWERETTPRAVDVALAEAMIEAGADMIFGHHQHRLNPLTSVAGRPVAWGLGNFIWQPGDESARQTAIAQVVVEPDGTLRSCLIPARIIATGVVEITGAPCHQEPDYRRF